MAHDVLIAGALFPDVPSVQFPDSQQQWHSFTDVSDTTAAAADVASGKQFYDASGVLTQGTASGGGGGGAPKMGVLRPDAELWKSWTYDKMAVADEGVTLPAYSTSAQTIIAGSDLETVTLDFDSYDYELCFRSLIAPTYNSDSLSNGRLVYSTGAGCYEFYEISGGTLSSGGKSYDTRMTTIKYPTYYEHVELAWSSGSALRASSPGSSSWNGAYADYAVPSPSGASLPIRSPAFKLKGSNNWYSSTHWGRTTDIRCQYVIELYRTAKSNQYFEGYAFKSQMMHAIACAQSATGKLT